MAGKIRLVTKRFFIFLNLIAAVIFLLACLAPYINPKEWWILSLLGLGFSIIFSILILFIIFWLVVNPRYILLSLIPLAIGYKGVSVLIAVNNKNSFNYNKPKNVLRIVSWNVARFIEWRRNNNSRSQIRLQMMQQLKEQNADVLCLQEFFTSTDSTYYNNLRYVKEKLGYPYHYYSWDGDGSLQWVGQIILSKHPIVDSSVIHFPPPTMQESLIQADIVFNKDTVRIYNTHLQSVQFRKKEYEQIEKIKKREDSLLLHSKSIFDKLKTGFIYRSIQANITKDIISNTPHPYIICGDFNDVPNSYTYFTIKGKAKDAFLEKGFGLGRTFSGISPTLRIDYILPTRHFTVQQYNRVPKKLSDHYMQVADVQLTK